METTRSEFSDLTSCDEQRRVLTKAFQELLSEFPINSIERAFKAVRRDGVFFASGNDIFEAACKLLRSKATGISSSSPPAQLERADAENM